MPRGRGAPALGAVRSAVRRDLRAVLDAPAGPTAPAGGPLVLVACSGGPDSLALAAAVAAEAATPSPRALRASRPFRAGAVVVDHGWHPGSAGVAARTAAVLAALGLAPVVSVRADRPRPDETGSGGPEARARRARHEALAVAAADHGALAVLLGHTGDDQAEQVLLGLARGSGARSLAGMPAVRGVLRRPLLGLVRATTLAACAEAGLDPWHDPANTDPSYARARVRTRVLPVLEREIGPGAGAALVRTADRLRADADALDALADALAARAVTVGGPADGPADGAPTGPADPGAAAPPVVVDLGALAGQPAALTTRVLRGAALRAGCPATDLTWRHVLALSDLAQGPPSGRGPLGLPGGITAARRCGTLRLWNQPT